MIRKCKLMNLYETANRFQISPGWLRDAALAGKVPCLRIGKRKLRFELQATKKAIVDLAASKEPQSYKTTVTQQEEHE